MTLEHAILHLVRIHTKDDDQTGFQVKIGAYPTDDDGGEYVKAWDTLRAHLGLRTGKDGKRVKAEPVT